MSARKAFARALLAAVLAGVGTGAWAQGVAGSKHDLSSGGGAQQTTPTTDQVCIFCHTPHGSDITAPVPLWNKVLQSGSYTRYSNLALTSFESGEAPIGSVTLACLSCHDGTQAMDTVLNLPGSGGYNAAGQQIDVSAIGVMTGTPVPMLGTDLSNDHPVSMQYGGGGATSTDPNGAFTGTLGDPDFNAPVKDTINTQAVWWVDSPLGTALTREKTDMTLYSRNELGAVQPFVECASCHDPHNAQSAGTTSVAFLRITNTASRICTTCHIK